MNDINFDPQMRPAGGASALPGRAAALVRDQEQIPMLTRYLRVGLRWRWLILGSVVLALVIGLLVSLLMTPQYTATSTIEISRDTNKVVQVEGVEPESNAMDQEFYQTQYGLLKSQSLAQSVARELRLADNPRFFEMYGVSTDDDLFESSSKRRVTAAERDQRTRMAADILLANLDLVPVRLSRLVAIQFTSPDPEFSAQVANAWTEHFIRSNLQRRFEATSYARRFLEDRLEQLRQRLEQSERQLVTFAANQRIINIQSPSANGETMVERPVLADELVALNNELSSATADRIRAESRLNSGSGGATVEGLGSGALSDMRAKRADAAAEYARLMVQFEPGYPAAREASSRLAQLDRSIAREEARIRETLQNNYRNAMARERQLEGRVNGLKSGMLDLRRRSIQYNIYQRDVDTNRELYNGLLQRYKEIGIAGGVGTNNVAVVDPARRPESPSSPRIPVNLAVALMLGLLVGVALAFAAEQIDETITDPTAVGRALKLPLLGTIPKTQDSPIEALRDRKSTLVEAYLSVQTSLEFSTEHGVPRTLTVSSTRPAEGKSTTAFAIAASLARAKRKVILIDADMRSPSVHSLLGLRNDAGLSNFLAGNDALADLSRSVPEWGMDVMAAGPPPPNAGELLTGDRFNLLLERLGDIYDHVVIDSPPVLGLADAPLIASRVEGTIFAIESNGTRARTIRIALGRLLDANSRILGIVLTKFEAKRAHYGYGYDYGYGYGQESTKA